MATDTMSLAPSTALPLRPSHGLTVTVSTPWPHRAFAANLTGLSPLCPTVIWPTLIGTRVLSAGAGGVLVLVTVSQISKQQSSGASGTAKGYSFYLR